jgi:hypothetical protein
MASIHRACTLAHRELAIADTVKCALGPNRVRCRRRDRLGRTVARFAARVMSRSLLRSRGALLRPGSLSSLSLLFVGWVERQRHPSPAPPRAPGSIGFAHSAQPILRIRIFRFFVPGTFRARVLSSFLLSFRSPTEGMAERRSAARTSSHRLRLPQATSKPKFSSLALASSRLYDPQGTSSSTGIGLGVDASLEQAFRLLCTRRSS